jgi:hypothetical protein
MTMPRKKNYEVVWHFAGEFVVPAEENEVTDDLTIGNGLSEKKPPVKSKPKRPSTESKANRTGKRPQR